MGLLVNIWTYVYRDVYRENDFAFYVVSIYLVHLVIFWGLGCFFMFVDLTGKPKWMLKFKIQPGINQPMDPNHLVETVKVVFINHTVIGMAWFIFILYPLMTYTGYSCKPEDLPSFWEVIRHGIGGVIFAEIYFYYMHRLFHWGPLYGIFHKKHHEWKAPIGIASMYCHPLEHVIVNLPTYTLAPGLMGSHLFFHLLWYANGLYLTVLTHSNYHLPFVMSSEWHDYHHYSFNSNFGSELGILDWIHGTSVKYKKSVASRRDKLLVSFRSARELWPDEK